MKDKCCRHKRLLSHDCVKCIKCKRLKRSLLNEQLKQSNQMLCIHGRRHNTCGDCIRRTNEKMKRKVTKLNSNSDNFCEHFESVELCKE